MALEGRMKVTGRTRLQRLQGAVELSNDSTLSGHAGRCPCCKNRWIEAHVHRSGRENDTAEA